MDFLEQPRWITSSGNTIDIGTPGPENSVLIGGGNETNPMWEQSTQAGEILQNVGGNQVMWRQPIITELNGGSIYGASIYAPSSPGNRDDILVSNASGEPFWRAPLIRALNGNAWSFGNNNYSIYAPNTRGNPGEMLVANGNGGTPSWAHHNKVYYGYCSTQDTTATKTIYLYDDDYVELKRGTILIVDFNYGSRPDNSSSSWKTNYGALYLSVPTSGDGSRTSDLIYYRGSSLNRYVYSFGWDDAQCVTFLYNNGGNWEMIAGGSGYVPGQGTVTVNYQTDSRVIIPSNTQYDRIVSVMCRDTRQYGRIELEYGINTSYFQIINSCENQHGYWQAMEMCLTGFVPGGYNAVCHINANFEATIYYDIQYLFT